MARLGTIAASHRYGDRSLIGQSRNATTAATTSASVSGGWQREPEGLASFFMER